MDFRHIDLPDDIAETLAAVYKKAVKINPDLTPSIFMRQIIMEWLEPFERNEQTAIMKKGKVSLRNNLKRAIKLKEKTITQTANEIGIDRVYLSQVIHGRYEPSITLVLLLVNCLGYPPEKIKDLFYLEPVP